MTSFAMVSLVVVTYTVLLGPFYMFRFGPWLREHLTPAAGGDARMSGKLASGHVHSRAA